MEMINLGKIVSTHGIKGEVKVISNFLYKDKAFKKGNKVHLTTSSDPFVITSYRKHKQYDLLTFENITNINEILSFIPCKIMIEKKDLSLDKNEYLDEELIGIDVFYLNKLIGKIDKIFYASKTNKIIRVKGKKEILIPYNDHFIKKIDLINKKIEVLLLEGMNDEN